MKQWSVVHTRPKQESRAVLNLKQQGYTSWLPVMMRSRRHARRVDTIKEPFFPGYVFVCLDTEHDNWSPINGTFGVKYLITDGKGPSTLPAGFVEALQQTIDSDGACTVPAQKLVVGDVVKLTTGPFVDCVASVQELMPGDRIRVLLEVLGGGVTAMVSKRAVVSVP